MVTQEKQEVSLKGGNPRWSGMSDQSAFVPTGGTFKTLRNCYVSQDGTEIRRMPPLTLWADPVLADVAFLFGSMTPGTPTQITTAGGRHRIEDTGTTFTYRIYVTGNGSIPNGWYTCYRVNDTTLAVNVTTVGSSTTGTFYVERATTPFGMRMVGNRLCIVAESRTTEYFSNGNNPKNSLATWVQQGLLDKDNTVQPFEYWSSPLNSTFSWSTTATQSGGTFTLVDSHGIAEIGARVRVTCTGFGGGSDGEYEAAVTDCYKKFLISGFPGGGGPGTVAMQFTTYNRPPRRKPQLDVADNRLLIAVPGDGVMYQAHLANYDIVSTSNIVTKKTRALGVPKGVVFQASPTNTGSGELQPGANYWYSVGYKDRFTGEYGLLSDPVQINMGGGDNTIQFRVFTPRAVLREVWGCAIILYLSDANSSPGTMRLVVETIEYSEIINHNALITVYSVTPLGKRVPDIENMPMGGSVVRTVKGTPFFAGMISSTYDNTVLGSEQVSIFHRDATPGVSIEQNEIAVSPLGTGYGEAVSGAMAADYQLPTSFGGLMLAYESKPVMPLKKRLNCRTLTSLSSTVPPNAWQMWELDGVHENAASGTASIGSQLLLPRGMYWWSERGFPGVSPATNRNTLDRLRGYDVTALGRMGDVLILCTDKETYSLVWDRSPIGADPRMVSSEFGCIAASSMVQFDDGLAWLSERGPVAMIGGAFVWIGDAIYERWRSVYKRDLRGQMPHAFAAHDPTRKLLLFFLRRDLNSATYAGTANDDLKSKVPCDEVLVFNYAARAWSYWELPAAYECVDAEMVLCDDGQWRLAILTSSKLVYAFDETLNATTTDPITVEIITNRHVLSNVERNSKVGAVMTRNETDPVGPGFIAQVSAIDDNNVETLLTDNAVVNYINNTRSRFCAGAARGHEAQIRMLMVGIGPLRIKDIVVEASPGG